MSDNVPEFELLRSIGEVQQPEPRILEDAREAVWSAVASAMLDIGLAGEVARTGGRPAGRRERRRQPDQSQNGRRMSTGGPDPGR